MTALPRGKCPLCGADVALRKGGLVREHVGSLRWDGARHGSFPRKRVCRGTAKKAKAS